MRSLEFPTDWAWVVAGLLNFQTQTLAIFWLFAGSNLKLYAPTSLGVVVCKVMIRGIQSQIGGKEYHDVIETKNGANLIKIESKSHISHQL